MPFGSDIHVRFVVKGSPAHVSTPSEVPDTTVRYPAGYPTTIQEKDLATHAMAGTRSNTDPELRLRHTSNLLHELTDNVRLSCRNGVLVPVAHRQQAQDRERVRHAEVRQS
jgi:hypothetical protein